MPQDEEFAGHVRIVCPFCGKLADLGLSWAVHEIPVCLTFEELPVADYVHEVHEIFVKTRRAEDQRS
jgi:hypothetical protein